MASLLSKKVAIVTGASSGIGEAIALMFASNGAKVTLGGRDGERLKSTCDKLVHACGGLHGRFLTVQGDLNDKRVRKQIVDQTIEKFGRLDILVANAALTRSKQSVLVATEDTYDVIMDTNLKSVFFLIQNAIPHLEKSKGNIINISSTITSAPCPTTSIYSMSKIALEHLTSCLALELGPKGIRVNSVHPGFIPTRMLRHHGDKMHLVHDSVRNIELDKQVLSDSQLTVEHVAKVVTFLASEAADIITGEFIKVDGGRNLTGPAIWPRNIKISKL